MDHYETLGVPKNSDTDAIKKAYKRMALKHHPDKGGEPDKFKAISEAYEVLGDEDKRKMYDTHGPNFENTAHHGGRQYHSPGFSMGDMGDVFGSFFGGMGGIPGVQVNFGNARNSSHPRQTKHNITLPLKDFYMGKKVKRAVSRLEKCGKCEGRGGAMVHENKCIPCGGDGFSVTQNGGGFAIFQGRSKCQACEGTGKSRRIEDPCSNCSATGRVSERVIIEPSLKPGDRAGTKCVFQGLGNYTGKDPTGDIVITINPEPSEFKRRGNDLHLDRQISLKQCLVGFSMNIIHLDGRVIKVSVPSGEVTKPGTTIRVQKEGIPRNHGCLFVTFSVKFPTTLSESVVKILDDEL